MPGKVRKHLRKSEAKRAKRKGRGDNGEPTPLPSSPPSHPNYNINSAVQQTLPEPDKVGVDREELIREILAIYWREGYERLCERAWSDYSTGELQTHLRNLKAGRFPWKFSLTAA